MKIKLPKPEDVLECLRDKGFNDEIYISTLFFGKSDTDVWFYYSKNEEDFNASGPEVLVGETYDELEDPEEATADGLASLIIMRYRGLEVSEDA
jgi:hypothetical protein